MMRLVVFLLWVKAASGWACSPEAITENSVPEPIEDYAAALYKSSDFVVMVSVSRIDAVPGLDADDVHFSVLSQIKGEFLETGIVRITTGGCPSEIVQVGEMRLMFLKRDGEIGLKSVHRDPKFASYSTAEVLKVLMLERE